MLIDATLKEDFPPISLPKRPFMENAPSQIWDELGSARAHAADAVARLLAWRMGRTSSISAAQLAVEGDYFETGKIIAQRRRKDVEMNTEIRRVDELPDDE